MEIKWKEGRKRNLADQRHERSESRIGGVQQKRYGFLTAADRKERRTVSRLFSKSVAAVFDAAHHEDYIRMRGQRQIGSLLRRAISLR